MAWDISSACHALDCPWVDPEQIGGLFTGYGALDFRNFESLGGITHWNLMYVLSDAVSNPNHGVGVCSCVGSESSPAFSTTTLLR